MQKQSNNIGKIIFNLLSILSPITSIKIFKVIADNKNKYGNPTIKYLNICADLDHKKYRNIYPIKAIVKNLKVFVLNIALFKKSVNKIVIGTINITIIQKIKKTFSAEEFKIEGSFNDNIGNEIILLKSLFVLNALMLIKLNKKLSFVIVAP